MSLRYYKGKPTVNIFQVINNGRWVYQLDLYNNPRLGGIKSTRRIEENEIVETINVLQGQGFAPVSELHLSELEMVAEKEKNKLTIIEPDKQVKIGEVIYRTISFE
jgi:hypothetical protein